VSKVQRIEVRFLAVVAAVLVAEVWSRIALHFYLLPLDYLLIVFSGGSLL
jgi:hypothetical protein